MIATRVLAGLGASFRRHAGEHLSPLVESLTGAVAETDELVSLTPDGWAAAFDIDGPRPGWLAQLVGIVSDPTLTTEQQREIIRTRPSWSRGTYKALVASIKTGLINLRRVVVDERDTGAWHATISIYESDFASGTTQATIIALAERHRPAGVTFDFVFYPPHSYGDAENTAGTYDTAEATAGTYDTAEE
ncbi:hypothetical protein [Microbacterium karelineae]|uniref:hypothetical protein n=1 Tax=Microbacterium karelineae TaxID=2654283 RepID=UPI0012E9EAC8|nr:hypothetical protein [Microbacterium karelineae]